VFDQNAELVPANTTDTCTRIVGNRSAQGVCGLDQHDISHLVTLGVVDGLEAVYVTHDQCDVLAIGRGFCKQMPQAALENTPVSESRQRIAQRQLLEFSETLRLGDTSAHLVRGESQGGDIARVQFVASHQIGRQHQPPWLV
jgi:hypothetical protein